MFESVFGALIFLAERAEEWIKDAFDVNLGLDNNGVIPGIGARVDEPEPAHRVPARPGK